MSQRWLVLILVLVMGWLPGCSGKKSASRSRPSQPTEKTASVPRSKPPPPSPGSVSRSEEYRRQGKAAFDVGNYQQAWEYCVKSNQENPNNQGAFVLAGAILVKQGKGDLARQHFQRAVGLSSTTQDAKDARVWLETLANPLKISIVAYNLEPSPSHPIANLSQEILTKLLADTKLYGLVDWRILGGSADLGDPASACRLARDRGTKIIIYLGTDYQLGRDAYNRTEAASCRVQLRLYATKDGQLVKTMSKSDNWPLTRESVADKLSDILKKMTQEIHATLM